MVNYVARQQEKRPKVWKDIIYYSDGLKIAA